MPGPFALSDTAYRQCVTHKNSSKNMVYACVLPVDLIVCSLSHPQAFLMFFDFFFSLLLHPVHAYTDQGTIPIHICRERDEVLPSCDCDVVAPRVDVAQLCCRSAFATPAAPPIKDPSALNIGKTGNIPPRFAVGSIRFFVVFFFFVFTFVFMPMPDLHFSFHCRPNG